MNAPKEGLEILHSPNHGELSVLKGGTVTLDNMPTVAWSALNRGVGLTDGSQLRDVAGVASIEIMSDQKSIRVGVSDEKHREAIAAWLEAFIEPYLRAGYGSVLLPDVRIEREDYTLTPGIPLRSGEGFVRIDAMSQLARLTLRGLSASSIHMRDGQEPHFALDGVTGVVTNPQLYGEGTAIVHTDTTPNMTHHLDRWLAHGITSTLEQRAKTEESLRAFRYRRTRPTPPADAPDSV